MGKINVIIIPDITKKSGHLQMICKANDYEMIYNKVMRMTGNDHEIAADAASWCELATVGEIYEFREGIIKIEDAG